MNDETGSPPDETKGPAPAPEAKASVEEASPAAAAGNAPEAGGGAQQHRNRPGRRHRPGPEGAPEPRGTAGELERLLGRYALRVREKIFGTGSELPKEPVRLQLAIELDLAAGVVRAAGMPFQEQIARALQDEAARSDLYRPGRVHCHRCGNADCEHAVPPRPQAVFAGWSPAGQPEWRDFAQVLVDRKDPRVEELFAPRPPLLPLGQTGKELKERLLRQFGRSSKTYDLLGQVAVGGFREERSIPGETGREHLFSLTLQVVEGRHPDGRHRLWLNVVGQTPGGTPGELWLVDRGERWFHEEITLARRRLAALEASLAPFRGRRDPATSPILGRIPGLVAALVRGIEQSGRQRGRRTLHSEERRRESRPTPAAFRDAKGAPDEAILADERKGTLVVLGPKGRVHVFSPEGRHVTSLSLPGDALERRMSRERWRPAKGGEIAGLRAALSSRGEPPPGDAGG